MSSGRSCTGSAFFDRPSARTTIRSADTYSTTPGRLATTTAPESRATTCSIPVPTNGASGCRSGTAWRCMFEPIRARFASSFSRTGISAAGAERREPPLVRELRQRVRLVHELRQLRRAEELLDHRGDGLRVDEVVRHQVRDVRDGHPLLDGALHPREPDPELVLEQLADRPDPPVAQVIDVIRRVRSELHRQEMTDHLHDVLAP